MAEGGALSFSQAKVLILKQRLSAAEVQTLQSAPQTIFTERDKEVLFYLIFLTSFLSLFVFLVSYHFLVNRMRVWKNTTCCSIQWSLATSRLLMSFWSGVMSIGKMTKVQRGKGGQNIPLLLLLAKNWYLFYLILFIKYSQGPLLYIGQWRKRSRT